jgi:pimeloyl-ACP methyl ester carboxylesterase
LLLFAPSVGLAARWTGYSELSAGDFVIPSAYTDTPLVLRPEAALDAARYTDEKLFNAMRRSAARCLLVAGTRDEVAPLGECQEWLRKAPLAQKELVVVDDDHRLQTEFSVRVIPRIDSLCRDIVNEPWVWKTAFPLARAFGV